MGALTEIYKKKALEKLLEGVTYGALVTTEPTATAAGTVATFTGYERKKIEAGSTGWTFTEGTEAKAVPKSEPEWVCTAGESKVVGVEIWTAQTGGERIYYDELSEAKTISATSTPAKLKIEVKQN